MPADRFFGAAPDVLRTLRERVAANALELARQGAVKPPFYVTGQVAGQAFSVHAEGERMILTRAGEARQEVDLVAPACSAIGEQLAHRRCTVAGLSRWFTLGVACPTKAMRRSFRRERRRSMLRRLAPATPSESLREVLA